MRRRSRARPGDGRSAGARSNRTVGLGLRTLVKREVVRFLRVPGQTVASPLVTTALYFLVFGGAIGSRVHEVNGVPYARFIVPGLVALGVVTNAFANSSSSMFQMKLMGTVIDLLVTPLSYGELLAGFLAAAVIRGAMVGLLMWLVAAFFTGFGLAHPLAAVGLVLLIAAAFGALGLMIAIWAEKFEQVNFVPTFLITPLTFLGGVFYSVSMLSPALERVTLMNPVFYMVDTVRWAMLGRSDSPPLLGGGILVGLCVATVGAAWIMLKSGYKLRG